MEREEALAHFGVKGMHWGLRRNPTTGVRPVAQKLNDSAFGRKAQRNVDKHDARKAAKLKRSQIEVTSARGERAALAIITVAGAYVLTKGLSR